MIIPTPVNVVKLGDDYPNASQRRQTWRCLSKASQQLQTWRYVSCTLLPSESGEGLVFCGMLHPYHILTKIIQYPRFCNISLKKGMMNRTFLSETL